MLQNFLLAISESELQKLANPLIDVCETAIPILLSVVGAVGAIYCIILGVKYATAEDPQEHEKMKKALKNAIVGFVLIFVLLISLDAGINVFKAWYTSSVVVS